VGGQHGILHLGRSDSRYRYRRPIGGWANATNAPNVRVSGFEVNPNDPRPLHRGWHYAIAEDQQRTGRNSRFPTKDAEQTTVRLYFTHGADPVRDVEGVFLKSAVESPEAMTTLVVGRPRHIPAYLVATESGAVPAAGVTVHPGTYMTNGEFFHQDLTELQRLEPGTYEVIVEVRGKWGSASFRNALTVPHS
jgi:hypothetical protein